MLNIIGTLSISVLISLPMLACNKPNAASKYSGSAGRGQTQAIDSNSLQSELDRIDPLTQKEQAARYLDSSFMDSLDFSQQAAEMLSHENIEVEGLMASELLDTISDLRIKLSEADSDFLYKTNGELLEDAGLNPDDILNVDIKGELPELAASYEKLRSELNAMGDGSGNSGIELRLAAPNKIDKVNPPDPRKTCAELGGSAIGAAGVSAAGSAAWAFGACEFATGALGTPLCLVGGAAMAIGGASGLAVMANNRQHGCRSMADTVRE